MYEKLFSKIYIEESLRYHPRVQSILNALHAKPEKLEYLENYQDVFGSQTKEYLLKRHDLALFLAEKKGQLVKEAPLGYAGYAKAAGGDGDGFHASGLARKRRHFYFIHAYNCIYECSYCYLQGYFRSPDIVLFMNHEDILAAMKEQVHACDKENTEAVFHSGEFSDSLALSKLSKELPLYWDFFAKHPSCSLELRSKSLSIQELFNLKPLKNICVTMSLSSEAQRSRYEEKTPPIASRIKALTKLAGKGFSVGMHLDPLIYDDGFKQNFSKFALGLFDSFRPYQENIRHISVGLVRFSNSSWKEFRKNYSHSGILAERFYPGFDGKQRYLRPLRKWMLGFARATLIEAGFSEKYLYDCMDN